MNTWMDEWMSGARVSEGIGVKLQKVGQVDHQNNSQRKLYIWNLHDIIKKSNDEYNKKWTLGILKKEFTLHNLN